MTTYLIYFQFTRFPLAPEIYFLILSVAPRGAKVDAGVTIVCLFQAR